MSLLDRSYFEQRAEAELQLAQQASHPAAVKAHNEMAGHYLDRIGRDENSKENGTTLSWLAEA